jgi:hypothetical protein
MNDMTQYASEQSNGEAFGQGFAPEFEHLPFAGEFDLESQRRGRGNRSSMMRALPPPLPRRKRPDARWPGVGGGSSYCAVLAFPAPLYQPFPDPFSEPQPFQNSADFGDGQPDDGEVPVTLSATLARLPSAQRPVYQVLGAISAAIADPRSAGPGLYLIEFSKDGRRRAYSGQSGNVRKRLLQHQLCARMLGLSLAAHQVHVAPLPALNPAQRRALEQRIHGAMLVRQQGVLTNQRRELEVGLLGTGWE